MLFRLYLCNIKYLNICYKPTFLRGERVREAAAKLGKRNII